MVINFLLLRGESALDAQNSLFKYIYIYIYIYIFHIKITNGNLINVNRVKNNKFVKIQINNERKRIPHKSMIHSIIRIS